MSERESQLQKELASLLNRHCAENESNTPDFILAHFLCMVLAAYNAAVGQRDRWYNISPKPGA